MPANDEAHFLIRLLLADPRARGILESHRWAMESERWNELLHSLLGPVLPLNDLHARAVVERLHSLKLLEVREWSDPQPDETLKNRFCEVLAIEGVEDEAAARAASVISEAARSVSSTYGGKIQRCLRAAGERALDEISRGLAIPSLGADALRRALIIWLQNVANLPIPLLDDSMHEFCERHEVSVQELVAAADDQDLSVAVLDDLVHSWLESQRIAASSEPADGQI